MGGWVEAGGTCCPFPSGAGGDEEVAADDWGWEGRKEMESVPEKRTTLTARATGRTAVKGLG